MTSFKRLAAVTMGLAACVALTSAPASGAGLSHTSASFSICDPVGIPALLSHPAAIAARGDDAREPQLAQNHDDLPQSAKGQAGGKFSASVPVYFHVITAGSLGNLTQRQIDDQITVLNNTFAGREGGARTGFSFQLAGVTRTDNAAWFEAGPGGKDEHAMKNALHRGGTNALNFYSTTAGAYLGWAYLPDIVTKPGQAYLDGVVVDWASLPGTSTVYAGKYDQGETGTHEVGHWLNLEHTFFGGCNAKGDFVDDTPAMSVPTSGCPAGKDTCPAPGLDPIHNYMDYSYDSCYTEFTPGQAQRMRDSWLEWRA